MDCGRPNRSLSEQNSRIFYEDRSTFSNPYQTASSNFQELKKGKSVGVLLKVIIGKTVEAFKVSGGAFLSQGKAGVAILGNESQSRYDLYVYKEDQQKITCARITARFNFEIHPHYYGTFYDNSAVSWSLRFDQESDMTEFIREIALARWRSPGGNSKVLVQDVIYGDSRKIVTPESCIQVIYKISFLKQDNKFLQGASTRQFENSATSTKWEIPMTGAALHSKKIIILPSDSLGQWEDIVPVGSHVWLEMFVKDVFQQKLPPLGVISSCQSENHIEADESCKKDDITSRLVRMGGQALVPFPGFPSESDSQIDDDISIIGIERRNSVISDRSSLSQEETIDGRAVEKVSFPPLHRNMSTQSRGSCYPPASVNYSLPPSDQPVRIPINHVSTCPNVDEEMYRSNCRNLRDPEFNMLFSEIRTCNSEVRMSLMRVTDKVDTLLNKGDSNIEKPTMTEDKCLEKLDPIIKNVNNWLEHQENHKTSLNEKFEVIADQNQAIIEMLLQQQKLKLDAAKKLELMHDDINYLSNAQHYNTGRLKDSMSEGEGLLSKIGSDLSSTNLCKECKCHSNNHIAGMEACFKTLEERNAHLESTKIELDYQILQAEEKMSQLRKENEKICLLEATNNELTERISHLEKILETIKSQETEKKIEINNKLKHSVSSEEVSDAVKRVINQAYKALKTQLYNHDPDVPIQDILSNTLKAVTNNFLKKHGIDSGIEASEHCDENQDSSTDRRESDSLTHPSSSGRFSPTSCPLPPIRKPSPPPRLSKPKPDKLLVQNKSVISVITPEIIPEVDLSKGNQVEKFVDKRDIEVSDRCQDNRSFSEEELLLVSGETNKTNETILKSSNESVHTLDCVDHNEFPFLTNIENTLAKTDETSVLSSSNESVHTLVDQNISPLLENMYLVKDNEISMSNENSLSGEVLIDKTYTISEPSSPLVEEIPSDSCHPLSTSPVAGYVPLVNTEPPPLPSHSNSPSPTASSSLRPGETYSVITSKSDTSKSSKDSGDEEWRPQPPPLEYEEDEDEDAWLFNS